LLSSCDFLSSRPPPVFQWVDRVLSHLRFLIGWAIGVLCPASNSACITIHLHTPAFRLTFGRRPGCIATIPRPVLLSRTDNNTLLQSSRTALRYIQQAIRQEKRVDNASGRSPPIPAATPGIDPPPLGFVRDSSQFAPDHSPAW
jgi:hypothetical protein